MVKIQGELKRKKYSFIELFLMFVRHWQWFVLSMTICLCATYLYTHYVTPVYRLSAKIIIKKSDNPFHRSSRRMLSNIQQLGMVTNTMGIENEVERMWSSLLMHDVVMQLKLYTEYKEEGWPKDHLVYGTQPINVDLDPVHLDSLDQVAYEEFRAIILNFSKQSDADSTVTVKGVLSSEGEAVWAFAINLKSLPASIDTPYGTLTFTRNPHGSKITAGHYWQATIEPPLYKALLNLSHFKVEPAKASYSTTKDLMRYFYKLTSIANLSFTDQNVRRGTDILRQFAISYNRMATADNNEIARRSEAFINDRINRLSENLGSIDKNIESVLRAGGLTSLADAAQSVTASDQFSSQMTESAVQASLIDELSNFVNEPANRYTLIPASTGLKDGVTVRLINQHNAKVMERNNLLRSASEEAVPVQLVTATIDELHAAIVQALVQARHSLAISREGIASQYAKSKGRVSYMPKAEHALADAKREQEIRKQLYVFLLKKREDNTIALASTADHGRLIDEPICESRVRPNLWMAYGFGLAISLAIPYSILILMGLFRYKLENHKELTQLTELPVIADVPQNEDVSKRKAGIVVQPDMKGPLDEVFRLMRSNLHFMHRSKKPVILFTSTTSGEGKTFCAANLAMSYALLEKKVVLCGLDIRKPALGSLFGLADHSKGITLLLTKANVSEEDVQEQIQPSGLNPYLDLLMAGPESPNPTELLARDAFCQVLGILKDRYDYIILDTAPVGLVTDTLQISKYADVTIFVCRAHYTPKYAINQLNTMAEEKRLLNPCVVLNGC